MQKISDNPKADHSIGADAIPSRVEYLLDKKAELQVAKQTQIEYTNKCEQVKGIVIREYKYTKALSDLNLKIFGKFQIGMMRWRSFLITTTGDIFGQVEMIVRGSLI
jgi:hypothetical protein